MSKTESAVITIVNLDGRSEECACEFDVSHQQVVMKTQADSLGRQIWHGNDAFHALELFRRKIEPKGWRALCNGSRKNAYPSGMCRDMGRGFMLYPMPADGPRKLNTFEPAPFDEIGTVDEQLMVWNEWLDSRKPQSPETKPNWWTRFRKMK